MVGSLCANGARPGLNKLEYLVTLPCQLPLISPWADVCMPPGIPLAGPVVPLGSGGDAGPLQTSPSHPAGAAAGAVEGWPGSLEGIPGCMPSQVRLLKVVWLT